MFDVIRPHKRYPSWRIGIFSKRKSEVPSRWPKSVPAQHPRKNQRRNPVKKGISVKECGDRWLTGTQWASVQTNCSGGGRLRVGRDCRRIQVL
ncbi:hypothetical protein U1Q18_005863 [Sarracenia purpurea var. burkii]